MKHLFRKHIGGVLMATAVTLGLPEHWPIWVNALMAIAFLSGLDLHSAYTSPQKGDES